MAAKDTVMSDEQIRGIVRSYMPGLEEHLKHIKLAAHQEVALTQAELTWAAREPEIAEARREGIKECLKDLIVANTAEGAELSQRVTNLLYKWQTIEIWLARARQSGEESSPPPKPERRRR